MADEVTPDIESRVNGSEAFKRAVANLIGGLAANAGGNTLTALTGQTIRLHTADPGETGINEVVAAGSGYAAKPVVWTPATSDGGAPAKGRIVGDPITFDVPAGDIKFYSVWQGGTVTNSEELRAELRPQALPREFEESPLNSHAIGRLICVA